MSLSLENGEKIRGRYELIQALGSGGLGGAFLAEDIYRNEKVVIKAIFLGRESRWTVLAPWEDELNCLRRLMHPNIPAIRDQFSFDQDREGYLVTVQEYADGLSLDQWVEKNGPLSPFQAKTLLLSILDAMEVLEREGIAHGGLSPKALIFPDEEALDKVQLVNFGVVNQIAGRIHGAGEKHSLDDYRAPELLGQDHSTMASDFYSLGLVLIYGFTGVSPLSNPALPPGSAVFGSVISWLCQGSAQQRPGSVGELILKIKELEVEEETQETESSSWSHTSVDYQGIIPENQGVSDHHREGIQPSDTSREGDQEESRYRSDPTIPNEALGALPQFLQKAVRKMEERNKPPSGRNTAPFDQLRIQAAERFQIMDTEKGVRFKVPKGVSGFILGFMFLIFGGFQTFIFGGLGMEALAEDGLIFLLFMFIPILLGGLGVATLFGSNEIVLEPNRITRVFRIFGIEINRKSVPMEEVKSVFIRRVRGSKGGVSYYLVVDSASGRLQIGSGFGSLGKDRDMFCDLVDAWWKSHKRR